MSLCPACTLAMAADQARLDQLVAEASDPDTPPVRVGAILDLLQVEQQQIQAVIAQLRRS